MGRWSTSFRAAVVLAALAIAAPAAAIPAFARKYGTSCLTCHTVYPKLTPFGEAFRRNGYRFPGVDSDYVKAEQIALGQEANKKTFPKTAWPDVIPAGVPLAVGANGQALVFPSKTSTAGRNANGAKVTLQDLAGEGHLWAGAALDDTITAWAEVTFADGGAEVEHAQLLFGDLFGPKHAVNLIVGHGFPNVTQFGPHSSYLGDAMVTTLPVTAIYRDDQDPWTLVDNYTGAEVNGVVAGRVDYAVGVNAGKIDGDRGVQATDNFYGRVGFKLGGMRLDGEGSTGAADAEHPWAEDALGVYAFGYQANSRLAAGGPTANDTANVLGGGVRGQYGSAELNLGYYTESHDHALDDGSKVTGDVFFGELSYVLYPWMVPVLRVERVALKPSGGTSVSDLHIQPGLAFLIRANIKLVTTFDLESSNGFPTLSDGSRVAWQGGTSDWGPIQIAPPESGKTKVTEFQSIGFFLAWAM